MRHLLVLALSLTIAIGFAWYSVQVGDWQWFSRSGSLIIVVALLGEYWPIFLVRSVNNVGFYPNQATHTATRFAIPIACIGTLIWGYGDCVGPIL